MTYLKFGSLSFPFNGSECRPSAACCVDDVDGDDDDTDVINGC